MIYEQIEDFTEGLIDKTKANELQWMPLSAFHKMRDLELEFNGGFGDVDFGVNSIRESASYFLKSGEGYVFLFEIFHGDSDVTSPDLDTIALMVKINSAIPIINLSSYLNVNEEHQEKLATLKVLIESYIDEKYSMPDTLYNFMNQVLSDDAEESNE